MHCNKQVYKTTKHRWFNKKFILLAMTSKVCFEWKRHNYIQCYKSKQAISYDENYDDDDHVDIFAFMDISATQMVKAHP